MRPAKSTRNCRTSRATKVLLPRSSPIDLEGTPNGSTDGNGCYLDNSPHPIDLESGPSLEDRVRCCIKSIETLGINLQVQQDQNMKPLGALDSREESSGTTSSYTTYVDTSGEVRQRIGLHASTKDLIPPEEGMRKIAVFTRLLPSTKLLHPRVRAYVCGNQNSHCRFPFK
ncbi:hypothetical protein YC2023_081920 [Brassica napus]